MYSNNFDIMIVIQLYMILLISTTLIIIINVLFLDTIFYCNYYLNIKPLTKELSSESYKNENIYASHTQDVSFSAHALTC